MLLRGARKITKESATLKEPVEAIVILSSEEENGSDKGGSSTSSHAGGQGVWAQHFHEQRLNQIFAEEGRTELLQAIGHSSMQEETGDSPQIEGASPSIRSRVSLRKPHTTPKVLKNTVHNRRLAEPELVSTGEQVEPESHAVSSSTETIIVSTSTPPAMPTTPQGLVLCEVDTPTMPTLTIRGPHIHIPSPEPEGLLVKELASSTGGTSSQHDSLVFGKKATSTEEESRVEVIEVDSESEGSWHSEITLNPRAAVERSARERGIRNRRSFRRRRLYQAVLNLHRLSDREIRRWTRDRGRAAADQESASPIGPIQVQRVRRPVRHPTETASPRARCVPSVRKGSEVGN